MTRQIYPHHAAPSVFAVEERLHFVEERLHRVESTLAFLMNALAALAEETDEDSHEDQDGSATETTAHRVEGLLEHVRQRVAVVDGPRPRPPQASA